MVLSEVLQRSGMSNHFSPAMLKFPGDDARLDLTESNGGTRTRTAYDATSACY